MEGLVSQGIKESPLLQCGEEVKGNASDEEDESVPGVYLVSIDGNEDINPSDADHQSAIAKAALDCFHDKVGIGVLDDFEIAVLLEDGSTINESEIPSQHEFTASLNGSISEQETPARVWAAFRQAEQPPTQQRSAAERGI